ncbi:hypothetical protein Q7P37_011270 [Cladosporium fusiforme]
MANRQGYDVVVDVDAEGDLGHTDLQEDNLEFHNSTFDNPSSRTAKVQPDSTSFLGAGPGNQQSSSKRLLWSISFYQQFFDVDTNQILSRCRAALYPRQNFLDVLEGNPDLYGPFWIATTVVVILFLTGTISQYLASSGKEHFAYDFKLLSGAAGLIYGYTAFIPLGLWGVLKWFGSESANLMECWALYGYANLIWIPVALVSWSPLTALNYAFVGIGLAMSAVFLFRNLYPVVSAIDAKPSRILLVVVVFLHAGLAIAIKILFFAHGSPVSDAPAKPDDPMQDAPKGDASGDGKMMFFYVFPKYFRTIKLGFDDFSPPTLIVANTPHPAYWSRKPTNNMAPKGKKGKKAGDDWDEGLGESADPIAQADADAKAADAADDAAEEEMGGGGLMAALKKNKEKRKKKGKAVDNDFLDGEDATATPTVDESLDLAAKAPVEAGMDDEEDVFGGPAKKGKGGKGGNKQQAAKEPDDEEGGGVKTKAQKEKEKKEREKQRKKEQKEEAKVDEPAAAPAPEPAAGGKKKKLPAGLAALQKQQEELRRRQEEDDRFKEEELARIAEEERLLKEEEAAKAEARAAKKERERKKVEEAKKAGTYKTEKQRKEEAMAKLRLQQMLESGAKVAGIDGEVEEKKKTAKDDRRKRNPRKEAEERKAREEEEARKKLEELKIAEEKKLAEEEAEKAKKEAEAKKGEDSDDLDDWEAMAEKEESDVKDSWDAESEDEEAAPKEAANGKADAKKSDDKDDEDSESDSEDDSEDDSDSDSDSDEEETVAERLTRERKEAAALKRKQESEAARAAASKDNLRSPICCILGHVDTGKTKLLDKIRQTNVQEGEAGGITQQIGATYFPEEALQKKTQVVNQDGAWELKVPGLLIIDTPGHESFTNLRTRGSSLCNIAILVVDIMHGLEPQTLESMKLLRDRKTPFIVALNKIDRLYGWKQVANNGFRESLALQNKGVQNEFRDRLEKTKLAFAEQSFNSELYYENKSMAKFVSLVPTSAHTGEGIPDMLKLILQLTQERMTNQLMYLSEVECTVLEVKVIEGLGTTIDVVLSNGILNEGDTIVLCGTEGPITTQIRALLTPAEMKELRLKSQYVHNKTVKAALGIKIAANGLDHAIAGSRLLVVKNPDDEDEIEELEEDVMGDLENLMSKISKSGRGVTVQASTLGSLEALLEFLRVSKIPVANISIGPVHKRDVITASTMLEKAKEFAVMLCFDVKVDKDAFELAAQMGVKIFTAEIIYHLFDDFTKHMAQLAAQRKEESKMSAVFPCVLRPVAVFNKTDPIVVGIDVIDGNLRINTPIAAVKQNATTGAKEIITLGRVTSIERDHKQIPICKKGQPSVAVKIEGPNQPLYGRHLEEKDMLYSKISRNSIDTLKEFYRDEVDKDEWALIAKHLKGLFDVV